MTTGLYPNPQHPTTGTTTVEPPHNPCTPPETTAGYYFPSDTDNILREFIQKLDASRAELISLTSDMQTLNAWCRSLQTENDHLAVDVKYLAAKCEVLELQGGNLCAWRDYLSREPSDLADHIDKLEAFSRRNNIRFFNVCEAPSEDYTSCARKVVQLLNEFYPFKTWMEEDVERAHRVGPKGNNQPHLLLARMHHWSDKLSLLSERTCRQNMANQVGVKVAADLTDQQQEELRKHSEQGRTAYYRSGRLHVRERQPKRRDPTSEVDKRPLESQLPP